MRRHYLGNKLLAIRLSQPSETSELLQTYSYVRVSQYNVYPCPILNCKLIHLPRSGIRNTQLGISLLQASRILLLVRLNSSTIGNMHQNPSLSILLQLPLLSRCHATAATSRRHYYYHLYSDARLLTHMAIAASTESTIGKKGMLP